MNLYDAIMRMQTIPGKLVSQLFDGMPASVVYNAGFIDARKGAAELASAAEELARHRDEAAPALLAALVALLNACTANSRSTAEERVAVIVQARAAIAKATE